jgi:hypothetical protein
MNGLLSRHERQQFRDSTLKVYRAVGQGITGLEFIGCGSWGSSVQVPVLAGQTYYVQAGSMWSGGGNLQLNVQLIPSPPNDDWANARVITGLPFDDSLDARGATREAGEPTSSCAMGYNPGGTTWYAFTPQETRSISANANASNFPVLAIYTGSSLTSLIEIGCRPAWNTLTFSAIAGTTYPGLYASRLAATSNAPPPVAALAFGPMIPSLRYCPVRITLGIQARSEFNHVVELG